MSILIKGMEMPSVCDACWALDEQGDYPMCRITGEQRGYNFQTRSRRMSKCPLVPIPPHGRLIDADVLLQRAISHGWSTPKWVSDIVIDNAPTIIEAEEVNDEHID